MDTPTDLHRFVGNPADPFGLAPEHVQFRDQFRRFVATRMAPLAERAEAERRFPSEVYALLRDGGYLGVNYPEDDGGAGGDLLMGCIFYEELTRAAAGVSAGVFAHQHLAVGSVLRVGNAEQRQQWGLPGLRGEAIGAFALTEPDAGSDIRGLQTRARRDDDDWVLNGSKLYITNGTIADFLVLAARTEAGRGADALTLFLVDARTPGIEARALDKLGNHSSSTAFMALDDVRVPASAVLGRAGEGLSQLKATLTDGRVLVANRGLGIAQEAVDLIHAYAGQRRAFGKTIDGFQSVAFRIADLSIRVEAARLAVYRAAQMRMAGQECVREASIAKFLASEIAVRASQEALLLHGGAGYMTEMRISRLYRDAPEAWIGEGTNEIQLHVISRAMGMRG
jgi:alkylation response protein AidB-like acyl-CoA dehydrogenase